MDLLDGKIKNVYFKYVAISFGSCMLQCIYTLVDMAMVGQYYGPIGTAAMSMAMPIVSFIYSLAMFAGVGGAVLYSQKRGQQSGDENQYFTASIVFNAIIALLAWFVVFVFNRPILHLLGADGTLLDMAVDYLGAIKFAVPAFVFNNMLASFLRNDNAPGLASVAIVAGGVFNMFGDWFFVFALDMGIFGAGLATASGAVLSFVLLLTHFATKKCTLKLTRFNGFAKKAGSIFINGFSAFLTDFAPGVLTVMFNYQVLRLLGTDALAVYGVIANYSLVLMSCAYSAGQAAQPILSINYGAGKTDRVMETRKYAIATSLAFGAIFTAVLFLIPNTIVGFFMKPTEAVLTIAPAIMRAYGISFILMPFNMFSTYYFQSVAQARVSMAVSLGRGLVLSGILIFLLPVLFGNSALWFTMPIAELAVAIIATICMKKKQSIS